VVDIKGNTKTTKCSVSISEPQKTVSSIISNLLNIGEPAVKLSASSYIINKGQNIEVS